MSSNRTEMLHFRATPEDKAQIVEFAGHAEVALSTWLRKSALREPLVNGDSALHERLRGFVVGDLASFEPCDVAGELQQLADELCPSYHNNRLDHSLARNPLPCCGAPEGGKHAEDCPVIEREASEADRFYTAPGETGPEQPKFRL